MYLEFPCGNCKKTLKISEEHLGRKVRCPYCHQAQVVQPPAPPSAPKAENPLDFLGGSPGAKREAPATTTAPAEPPREQAVSRGAGPREEAESGTDINVMKSGMIGLAIFVVVYAVLFPFRSWYLGALLWSRGWVQFAEVFLAAWSGAILVMKSRKLAVQRDSMLFDLLPEEISRDITPDTAGQFISHIRNLPVKLGESLLVNRVLRGLEHFGVLRNSGEVAGRLATQSEIDGNAVSSSYMLIKVFIWAIPILGFIGTVMGIGQAVGSFSSTMASAGDLGALKDSFNAVTGGLSTAFDTTLLALVLSMFIMFPMSSMQKNEQDLLNWVDEYCNENLLKRLKGTEAGPMPEGVDGKALQAAIDAALVPHHAELRAWGKKLEAIGDSIAQQITKGWGKLDEQVQANFGQSMKELCKSVESYQQITERLRVKSEEQAKAMAELARQTKDIQQRLADSMGHSSEAIHTAGESVQRYFGALERGVGSLNSVLEQLGQRQVVIQGTVPRRRFFGLFGPRNGG